MFTEAEILAFMEFGQCTRECAIRLLTALDERGLFGVLDDYGLIELD